ncbi:ribonuclease domain-containing protein [Kitasatospora sp. NPDC006697]|uniref:ribonuclease domain-containing protein n=1 Tax=Kitasatospora sp. NPDC006697 TaxID=3364020 RepID=UPI00369FB232
MPSRHRHRRPRPPRGRSALVALMLALAMSAVPCSASADPASSRALLPPSRLADLPPQVAAACGLWHGQLHWPATGQPVDYRLADGRFLRGGNPYRNRSGDLPAAGDGAYHEYDVNPRTAPAAHRDAERLVREVTTGQVWFTADHYADFRQVLGDC